MKRCPNCHRTFDDALSFCLEDGTPLIAEPASSDSEVTLVSPSPELPPTQAYSPMPAAPPWPPQAAPAPPYGAGAPGQRRVWPWILAIAALLFIGVVVILVVAVVVPNIVHPSPNDNRLIPSPTPIASPSPRPSPSPSASPSVEVSDVPTDSEAVLKQLERLENEWEKANVEGDKATLNRILADEYEGDSGGKQDYLSTITPHPGRTWRYRNFDLDLEGDTATLNYELDRIDGENIATSAYVDTFVWRNHRWQAVESHAVRLK